MGEKVNIKNRYGQNLVVLVEPVPEQKGLAFIMHGLGGVKEAAHLEAMAEAFQKNGYTVIRFDTTNTFGESDGNYEDATITNYYSDLEDVINWSAKQNWYQEPFCLTGHSLGGICTALYAQTYPDKVKALAPISTVVSGKLSLESRIYRNNWRQWKKTGWTEHESSSKQGLIKRLKWSHMEDRLKYDLLEKIDKLTMPVLLIVGENDGSTPPEQQKILFDQLPGDKELHIIKGAPHTFRERSHLNEIKAIFNTWLNKKVK